MNCPICNSDRVRRSRLRIRDVLLLLALHYPVRCRECSERWYVGIWAASKLPCPGGRVATIREPSTLDYCFHPTQDAHASASGSLSSVEAHWTHPWWVGEYPRWMVTGRTQRYGFVPAFCPSLALRDSMRDCRIQRDTDRDGAVTTQTTTQKARQAFSSRSHSLRPSFPPG